jgi:hypothetical protein
MLTKDTHIIAIKNYIDMTTIFFNRRQKVSNVPDRRCRSVPEVVVVRRRAVGVLGIWKGGGFE